MIITYIYSGILILISLLVQGHPSFFEFSLWEYHIKIDLLLIVIVYLGYSFGSFYGEVTGFIGGIFLDSVSIAPLGFFAFSYMAIGFIVGMFGREIIRSNIVTIALLIFIASLISGFIKLIISYIFYHAMISVILHTMLPEAFLTALFAPLIFVLFDKIFASEIEREDH